MFMQEKAFVTNTITTSTTFAVDNRLEVEKIRVMKSQNPARVLSTTETRCLTDTLLTMGKRCMAENRLTI